MNAPVKLDISKRVDQYVRLRDKITEMKERHKAELAPYNEALEKLNALLLSHLNEIEGESVRTEAGTVYRTEKKSASLADADAFMRFVIGTGSWDLLDRKANVTAVADFIEENDGHTPPGVNFSSTLIVGVRRK
jgi:hypothetical protein